VLLDSCWHPPCDNDGMSQDGSRKWWEPLLGFHVDCITTAALSISLSSSPYKKQSIQIVSVSLEAIYLYRIARWNVARQETENKHTFSEAHENAENDSKEKKTPLEYSSMLLLSDLCHRNNLTLIWIQRKRRRHDMHSQQRVVSKKTKWLEVSV